LVYHSGVEIRPLDGAPPLTGFVWANSAFPHTTVSRCGVLGVGEVPAGGEFTAVVSGSFGPLGPWGGGGSMILEFLKFFPCRRGNGYDLPFGSAGRFTHPSHRSPPARPEHRAGGVVWTNFWMIIRRFWANFCPILTGGLRYNEENVPTAYSGRVMVEMRGSWPKSVLFIF